MRVFRGGDHPRRGLPVWCRLLVICAFLITALSSVTAHAQRCSNCGCVMNQHPITRGDQDTEEPNVRDQHAMTRDYIDKEFSDQEQWMLEFFLRRNILPYMQLITEHLAAAAMHQAFIVGTLLDSKHQLERQRLFNTLVAEAQKDYHPSLGMCVFGTNVRSLAQAERRGDFTTFVLSQRALNRQLAQRNAAGADGLHSDLRARMNQFKTRYCDRAHNAEGMRTLCPQSAPAQTRHRDINYHAMVDRPLTLDIDFIDSSGNPTDDEIDIFALSDNLYAHQLMTRIPEVAFRIYSRGESSSEIDIPQNQQRLLDLQAVAAQRSVAQHSFNTIVGMKAKGSVQPQGSRPLTSADTRGYMGLIMEQLGVPSEDVVKFLGEHPSYFAQMDVLARRLYQRPEFYTDLYDKPANIDRKSVSMMAIKLMQDFDTWESHLRTEAMLSVWLELELMRRQQELQGRIDRLQTTGRLLRTTN